jgi:hypothetical protein
MKQKSVKEIKDRNKFKQFMKRFWWIVWKDDSFKGWLVSLLFIFIVIKFIFFPVLNLITGTTLPLAIVESCSMYHKGNMFSNFDTWWGSHEEKYSKFQITKNTFENSIFHKGFNKGDILFIVRAHPENLKIGDIIIFNGGQQNPIIHRIIKITKSPITNKLVFSTMGDNNNGQLSIEMNISEDQIVGKPIFRIAPSIGWGKLIFYEYKKSPSERGFCTER